MFLELPPELWDAIADAVHSHALGQVCRRLHAHLGTRRYARLCLDGRNEDTIQTRAEGLVWNGRCLELRVQSMCSPGPVLAALQTAPHLHTLIFVDVSHVPLEDGYLQVTLMLCCLVMGTGPLFGKVRVGTSRQHLPK